MNEKRERCNYNERGVGDWAALSDLEKVELLFQAPPWESSVYLSCEPEAEAARLLALLERRWAGLGDDDRVGILLQGPEWRRAGLRERLKERDGERLERLADVAWEHMSEETRVALLAEIPLRVDRVVALRREPDDGVRKRLLGLADELAASGVAAEIQERTRRHRSKTDAAAPARRDRHLLGILRNFWLEYNDDARLWCAECGWNGRAADGRKQTRGTFFDVACPQCGRRLLIVGYPTPEETRAAAAVGHPAAQAELDRATAPGLPMKQTAGAAEYEFCISSDGRLGRRRLVAGDRLVLGAAGFVPSLRRWRLDASFVDRLRYQAIPRAEAREGIEDQVLLDAPCPDPVDLAPHCGKNSADRLNWLDQAIVTTAQQIDAEIQRVEGEMPRVASGTRAYDYEMDLIHWIRHAHVTLESMLAEKQSLLAREAMRSTAGKDA
jgi:hypothetical protein